MADMKNYVWVFPIIAGILAFISLIAPAVSMNFLGIVIANFWFWDLYIYSFTGGPVFSGMEFVTEPITMVTNFITTGLLAIGGILLLIIGIMSKKRLALSKIKTPLILIGLVFIITEILWLIVVPIFFPMAYYWDVVLGPLPYNFWRWTFGFFSYPLHNPGFGVIGGFIAAALSFGGAGAAYHYSKEKTREIPKKEKIKTPTPKPSSTEALKLNKCPECGAEIIDPEIKYCGNCGYEFKTPRLDAI